MIALLAAALLAALVVVQVVGPRWSGLDWTMVAGLATAVAARPAPRSRPPGTVVAVAVTALLRVVT